MTCLICRHYVCKLFFLQVVCNVTWCYSWSAGLLPPELICSTWHCCVSNALQTVVGCVCKVVVPCTVIVTMTRNLYLHLILRHCTPSDVALSWGNSAFCYYYCLCVPNEQAILRINRKFQLGTNNKISAPSLADAHLVELSNDICSVQDPEHGSLCKWSRAWEFSGQAWPRLFSVCIQFVAEWCKNSTSACKCYKASSTVLGSAIAVHWRHKSNSW